MKKGIVVVSFGTTYERTRKLCIESVENKIGDEFRDYEVRRAFTSGMVINKLKERDNIVIDNVSEALIRMEKEGFEEIHVQSLHIIPGFEYEKMQKNIRDFKERKNNIHLKVGKPLLFDEGDYDRVIKSLDVSDLKEDVSIVYMGHGTDHVSDKSYMVLESKFREYGYKNVYIATVEGNRTIEDIIPDLRESGIKKVILKPFMLVAGDHATNDMAGDSEDSWKSILSKEGFEVETCVKGLGENSKIQDIFISHLKDTFNGI